jgi:predicted O-methyltransferase YrrM
LKTPNIPTTSWSDPFFSDFISATVRYVKPQVCVELGTYAGFSAFCIGQALLDNMRGTLDCYDLWEQYPYNHVSKQDALNNLVGLPIKLHSTDAFEVFKLYPDNSVDFMMVDISNDGSTYLRILEDWFPKLTVGATVLLEGGSKERDEVEWMKKYNKVPIQSVLHKSVIADGYYLTNIGGFPSMTVARRKT